jgi:hypothetical protein
MAYNDKMGASNNSMPSTNSDVFSLRDLTHLESAIDKKLASFGK